MDNDLYHKKISEGLKRLAGMYGPEAIIPADVVKVDPTEFTCNCRTDDDIDIPGVLFKSVSGGSIDVVLQPAEGSRIFIGKVSNSDEWVMIKAGAIDKVHIKIGDVELQMDGSGIVMNGGSLGGLVKRDGVKKQLNNLEKEMNELKTNLLSWTPVAGDGGAALKLKVQGWASRKVKSTVNEDIENTNVKQ